MMLPKTGSIQDSRAAKRMMNSMVKVAERMRLVLSKGEGEEWKLNGFIRLDIFPKHQDLVVQR